MGTMPEFQGDNKLFFGPVDQLHPPNESDPPVAYISFNGGRNDDATDTFLSHLVEVLEVRVEIIVDRRCPISGFADVDRQASYLLDRMDHLINRNTLASSVTGTGEQLVLHNVVLSEWEFEDTYRGGDQEILIAIYECVISNQQN